MFKNHVYVRYVLLRIRWVRFRIQLSRLKIRLLYGKNVLAQVISGTDRLHQPHMDEFRQKLLEIDELYEQAVREGKCKPMPYRLSEIDWLP